MFSLIETVIAKGRKYSQLFISTHNLDFLKYIKRLTIPQKENEQEQSNHFLVEKRKKDKNYCCFLKIMPPHLRDYVTEYNFLFKEIYDMACPFIKGTRDKYFENNHTFLYNLPKQYAKILGVLFVLSFPKYT